MAKFFFLLGGVDDDDDDDDDDDRRPLEKRSFRGQEWEVKYPDSPRLRSF